LEEKQKNRAVIDIDDELLNDISDLVRSKSDSLLQNILADIYPADIALIIDNLEDEESFNLFRILEDETAADVLSELVDYKRDLILERLEPETISKIVGTLDSDDAADIISELDDETAGEVLSKMEAEDSSEVKELLTYDENTAGGIMQKEFVVVKTTDSIYRAVEAIRAADPDDDGIYSIWVTDDEGKLKGTVSLKRIILSLDTPAMIIADIMNTEVISAAADTDQEEVAEIFRKYDLVVLPVVDKNNRIVGRILIDDIVDVIKEEYEEDVAKMVGSAAGEIESRSPVQIAWMRMPWVLITLAIQFFAGVVIHFYDDTLSKVILLTSFMPIISAISGNTGLQASAMTVRGLAMGTINPARWLNAVKRSLLISLIIGTACGIIIGAVGYMWFGKVLFGIVVGLSMCISINISAFIGTTTPLLSQKLGFDPAITVGPFETAFQDVIGITVFLTLSTLALKWLI
jgi:magnesium transporter